MGGPWPDVDFRWKNRIVPACPPKTREKPQKNGEPRPVVSGTIWVDRRVADEASSVGRGPRSWIEGYLFERGELKVVTDAILVCSSCGVEGEHELLYLSDHLRASRCGNCGSTLRFSEHVYAEYAWDVAGRTARFPVRFVGGVLRHPSWVVAWPIKAIRKPFSLLREVGQVTAFERRRRFRKATRPKDAAL